MPEPAGTLHVAPGGCADVARGRLLRARSRRRARRAGRRRRADRRRHSRHATTSPRRPATIRCSPTATSCSTASRCSPSSATTRDAARRAARLAVVEIEARAAARHRRRRARAPARRCCPTTPSAAATRDAALAAAPHRARRRSCAIGGQEHFYLEGQVALAIPGEDGDMHVHLLDPAPDRGAAHGRPRARHARRHGDRARCAAWAAASAARRARRRSGRRSPRSAPRVTGRPCKLRLDRDDDMVADRQAPRLPRRLDGRLRRRRPHPRRSTSCFAARCGYSADLSPGVADRAMFHADNAYWLPGRAHRLAAAEDQHRLQHRLPRLRRPAGHGRRRARDRRDRLRARPRSARGPQAQFLRAPAAT